MKTRAISAARRERAAAAWSRVPAVTYLGAAAGKRGSYEGLNLAWGAAADLILELAEIKNSGHDATTTDSYWHRAQRPLATALALAHQGAEFLLKARIAEVSPFLLLSGTPRDWPSGCEQAGTSYSDFRTLDAQDLVRAHDAVSSTRVSSLFRRNFERMRRIRNSVTHTVNKSQVFTARDVFRLVLETHCEFSQHQTWVSRRRAHLVVAAPHNAFPNYGKYDDLTTVARELRAVIDLLSPSECKALLGIAKKQRFYYCMGCHFRDVGLDLHVKTAHLLPNTPGSTSVYCYTCEVARPVRRDPCASAACRGNVLDEADEVCICCGDEQVEG